MLKQTDRLYWASSPVEEKGIRSLFQRPKQRASHQTITNEPALPLRAIAGRVKFYRGSAASRLRSAAVDRHSHCFLWEEREQSSLDGRLCQSVESVTDQAIENLRRRVLQERYENSKPNLARLLSRWKEWPSESVKIPSRAEHYEGVVKAIAGDTVFVSVSAQGDWDRFDAQIPLAVFNRTPEADQEFECVVRVLGSNIFAINAVMSSGHLPSLEDLGIDEEELLERASKLDV